MSKENPSFLDRQVERVAYVFLLLSSLSIGRLTATILTWFSFLVPEKKGKKKDFLFFPYAPKNDSGTTARFQIFLPYLDKDGYTYDIDYLYENKYYLSVYSHTKSRTRIYLLLHRVFWHRLFKVLTARNYKAIFFTRALFPEYYGQKFAYLERLLRKLNNNITVDFFDAEYARNKKIVDSTTSFCDKVCVVNHHLYQYFSKIHPRVYYNNLAVNIPSYIIKGNYELHSPIRIFWAGSIVNAENLKNIIPLLEKLNKEMPLKLVMTCPTNGGYTSPIIEQSAWAKDTFYECLAGTDIALYPALEDNEFTRGKMAYKVLEYVAAKVPVIASPLGLAQYFEDRKDVLIVNNDAEWEAALRKLIADKPLREKLSNNAYQKLIQYNHVDVVYENFVKILLS